MTEGVEAEGEEFKFSLRMISLGPVVGRGGLGVRQRAENDQIEN